MIGVEGADDLALHRDLICAVRKSQFGAGSVQRRGMLQSRAEDADFENRDGGGAEGSGNGSVETEALELAALFTFSGLHGSDSSGGEAILPVD